MLLGRHAREAALSGFLKEFVGRVGRVTASMDRRTLTIAAPVDALRAIPEGLVNFEAYEEYPSPAQYISLIAQSRFGLVPPGSGNRLSASGVLGDLLTVGTPVIAPREGAWRWQVAPQNRAFLYSDQDELDDALVRAADMSARDLRQLAEDVQSHGKRFDLSATTQRFAEILRMPAIRGSCTEDPTSS